MLQNEDLLTSFKAKVNEAIALLSKFSVDQKAEVWNFWELITITVKISTQVYVEESNKNKNNQNKKEIKTPNPNFESVQQNYGRYRKSKSRSRETSVDPDLDSESIRNDVKTLDFADLISCPSSVDTVTYQDGMYFVPSGTNVCHLGDSLDSSASHINLHTSCSATPHTPRVKDDEYLNYDFSSVDQRSETIQSSENKDCKSRSDDETHSTGETGENGLASECDKALTSTDAHIQINNESLNDVENAGPSLHKDTQFMYCGSESPGDVPVLTTLATELKETGELNDSDNDNNDNATDAHVDGLNIETNSETEERNSEKQTGKENKIPLIKIRKKKLPTIVKNTESQSNTSSVRYLNRKSIRKRKELQKDEYEYEVIKGRPKRIKGENSKGPVKCENCGKVLSNYTALKVHMRQHSGQRPFSCSICGKCFSTNGNRQRHEKSHRGEKESQCPECQKWFANAKNLEIHQRVHTGEKPFKCDICEKTFTQQGSLATHMDLHKGERRFLCTVCGRSFTQKSNLETHMLRHDSENRQFKCEQCSYSFFTKGELDRHSFKHTRERPFLCDFCPKSFTRVQYLNEHKSLHIKPRPYTCQKCKETFPDVSSLRKHKNWHKVVEAQERKKVENNGGVILLDQGEIIKSEPNSGEVIGEHGELHQTCIVTTSEITGMKQIIMAADKDLPPDVIQQFVQGGHVESDSMEVTHIVPVVQELDSDATVNQEEAIDDGSQDVYQITFLDTNSDIEHSNIIAAVDFSAMNLLAHATRQQYN